MSARPIEHKKRRKVAKAFRKKLPAYFDLVQYLINKGHAKSRRQARELILTERVKVNSHPVGFVPSMIVDGGQGKPVVKNVLRPHIRVELRPDITVTG